MNCRKTEFCTHHATPYWVNGLMRTIIIEHWILNMNQACVLSEEIHVWTPYHTYKIKIMKLKVFVKHSTYRNKLSASLAAGSLSNLQGECWSSSGVSHPDISILIILNFFTKIRFIFYESRLLLWGHIEGDLRHYLLNARLDVILFLSIVIRQHCHKTAAVDTSCPQGFFWCDARLKFKRCNTIIPLVRLAPFLYKSAKCLTNDYLFNADCILQSDNN